MKKKRKLIYYVAPHKYDSQAYAVRGKKRKEVKAEVERRGSQSHDKIKKVVIEYIDNHDLVFKLLGEGGAASYER